MQSALKRLISSVAVSLFWIAIALCTIIIQLGTPVNARDPFIDLLLIIGCITLASGPITVNYKQKLGMTFLVAGFALAATLAVLLLPSFILVGISSSIIFLLLIVPVLAAHATLISQIRRDSQTARPVHMNSI
jgi:hypothetical protein